MIEVHDLARTYAVDHSDVSVAALRGITFTIREGEMVSVMGASGSGKSTLLNLLGCLDRPSTGSYRLDGQDVGRLNADERAEIRNAKIGFVFQSFHLLPRTTARDNVELPLVYGPVPATEHRARAEEALASVGLGDATTRLPNQLSGGQQQRVAIARALVTRPKIILADEPTGNLDTRTSHDIMRLLQDLNRRDRLTLVIVTHEADIAGWTDRVLLLRDGLLVADGAPSAVLTGATAPELTP